MNWNSVCFCGFSISDHVKKMGHQLSRQVDSLFLPLEVHNSEALDPNGFICLSLVRQLSTQSSSQRRTFEKETTKYHNSVTDAENSWKSPMRLIRPIASTFITTNIFIILSLKNALNLTLHIQFWIWLVQSILSNFRTEENFAMAVTSVMFHSK